MTAHVDDFLDRLLSQDGDRYEFGHEVKLSDTDPAAFDCSELIEWAAYQVGVHPKMPDGSWLQARHCADYGTLIPISQGLTTRGALLFRFSSDPFTGGRPSNSHVAVSLGDGRTIEARGSRHGVGIFSANGRGWTHAATVPGLSYKPKVDRPYLVNYEPLRWVLLILGHDPLKVVNEDDVRAGFRLIGHDPKRVIDPEDLMILVRAAYDRGPAALVNLVIGDY